MREMAQANDRRLPDAMSIVTLVANQSVHLAMLCRAELARFCGLV